MDQPQAVAVKGEEHWTRKGDIKLFLWEKYTGQPGGKKGTVLFVHGSSMASQPTFDLQVPGRAHSSAMDYFARLGFDTWCFDMEGYGRSDKHRSINFDIANGADDVAAATDYIMKTRGVKQFLVYGISSGALRAALFAQRHPDRVQRLALDAFVWTGEGSPTLEERRKKLAQWQSQNRRPIDRAFVHSIFNRDHPGTPNDFDVWSGTRTSVTQPFGDLEVVADIVTAQHEVPGWVSPDGCRLYIDRGSPNGSRVHVVHRAPR